MSASPQPCAYCRRHAAVTEFLPFCSHRCKMADLGQWLSGTYRVPGAPADALTDQLDGPTEESGHDPDSQEHHS